MEQKDDIMVFMYNDAADGGICTIEMTHLPTGTKVTTELGPDDSPKDTKAQLRDSLEWKISQIQTTI